MGATVQIQDLILALSHGRATFPAEVGPGSTTTQINLAGLNLNNINLAGNFVMLDAGALGSGSPPTVTTISSNTATALTVPALPQAPTTGSLLWIFRVEAIRDVVPLTSITNQAANTNFATFTAPYAGVAKMLIGLATTSAVYLAVTPSGGTQSVWAINSGQALSSGELYAFEFPVSSGASYSLQVGTAQSGNLIVSIELVVA